MENLRLPTFLKWAGGKRRVLDQLQIYFPPRIERYFEPFLGGGSCFFYIKQKYNPSFCMISDINADLIETYKTVRDHPKTLLKHLSFFKKNNSEKFYYEVREKFNRNLIKKIRRCAAFIYLNKTCYNGLYRVNSKNEFNVPYGRYNDSEIYDIDTIYLASGLLKNVNIKLQDYREILKFVQKGDFVYLDPCYDPIKKTSFANYTPKRFCELDRINLSQFMRSLKNKDVKTMLSNNCIPEIRDLYNDFEINEIMASRSINSNPYGRNQIVELVIKSF